MIEHLMAFQHRHEKSLATARLFLAQLPMDKEGPCAWGTVGQEGRRPGLLLSLRVGATRCSSRARSSRSPGCISGESG